MNNSLTLGREELFAITGYKQKGRQSRWLRAHRIPFRPNALGQPVVSRKAWEKSNEQSKRKENSSPDWAAVGQ